jgi:hypothetical protein
MGRELPVRPNFSRTSPREVLPSAFRHSNGLKAHNVIAQAEGLGTMPPQISPAL